MGSAGTSTRTATISPTATLANAATVALKATIEPGGGATAVVPLDLRKLSLAVTATKLNVRGIAAARAGASVSGTLARHAGKLAANGDGFDAEAAFDGGLAPGGDITAPATLRWEGRIAELANRGDVPFALEAPATLSLAAGRVRLGDARIAVADGHANVGELAIDRRPHHDPWRIRRYSTRIAGEARRPPAAARVDAERCPGTGPSPRRRR